MYEEGALFSKLRRVPARQWEFLNSKEVVYLLPLFFRRKNMINELELYSISDRYISLLQERELDVYSNKDKIRNNARLIYRQKHDKNCKAGYLEATLDFSKLESYCREYIENILVDSD